MSIRNIKIQSPNKPKSPNKSPYYIKDLQTEIIKKLGINYSNIESINIIDTRKLSKKHIKYIDFFKTELNNEINLLFNLVKSKSDNKMFDTQLNIHINNLNDYIETINEMINSFYN